MTVSINGTFHGPGPMSDELKDEVIEAFDTFLQDLADLGLSVNLSLGGSITYSPQPKVAEPAEEEEADDSEE